METHLASNAVPHKAACGAKPGKLHVGQLRIARNPGERVTCSRCVDIAMKRETATRAEATIENRLRDAIDDTIGR